MVTFDIALCCVLWTTERSIEIVAGDRAGGDLPHITVHRGIYETNAVQWHGLVLRHGKGGGTHQQELNISVKDCISNGHR